MKVRCGLYSEPGFTFGKEYEVLLELTVDNREGYLLKNNNNKRIKISKTFFSVIDKSPIKECSWYEKIHNFIVINYL